MTNGFFQLVSAPGGYGVKIQPPTEGGEPIRIAELINYLDKIAVPYDAKWVKNILAENQEKVYFLNRGDCPPYNETYDLVVSEDKLTVTVRFFPPSDTGKRMSIEEFIKDLRYRNITTGVQMETIQAHFQGGTDFCTDVVVAQGTPPRHGTDAKIEYFFNTDIHIRPTVREDGSVDFFNLNTINHCEAGELLAKIIPEDPGEYGEDVYGNKIKPRDVKRQKLKFSHNIQLSEDGMSITSMVNGHVVLVDDKVFVSNIYQVENVDNSTGNIDYDGSVEVNGNIASNFVVRAKGNVIIRGVVEGAHVIAGGDIIIARGMNGMSKGTLDAGGNIVAKFLENSDVKAEGYIHTESILHSKVVAGTEIEVTGKRGFITGGHVKASDRVTVKTLGSGMGTASTIEVGVSPKLKAELMQLQQQMADIVKEIKNAQPTIAAFAEKKSQGASFTDEQMGYLRSLIKAVETKKTEFAEKDKRLKELQSKINPKRKPAVVVTGMAYPGVTIMIDDVSLELKSDYHYCRFEKESGDVKSCPM